MQLKFKAPLYVVISSLVSLGQAKVIAYPPVPALARSDNFAMEVNHVPVEVQQYNGNSFTRFSFSDSATVRITVSKPVRSYVLSPKSYGIDCKVNGADITFKLGRPRKLILRSVNNVGEKLFIIADPLETNAPRPGAAGVVSVLDFKVDNAGGADAAGAIQRAIDAVGRRGGTLFFPAGLYRLESSIRVRSKIRLYLEAGAVLQVPPNGAYNGNEMIGFYDAPNSALSGRGVVYGNGTAQKRPNVYFHGIYIDKSDGCSIQDVTILDPAITGIRIVDTRHCAVKNVNILAANSNGLSDGLDLDSASYVTASGLLIVSSDDCTAVKGGTGVFATVKDSAGLIVEDSAFVNLRTGAAFKIGSEVHQNSIPDITYRNVDVVEAMQLAAIYPVQGAAIRDVRFVDVRCELIRDRLLEFHIVKPTWEKWNGRLGNIRNVRFERVEAETAGSRESEFQGFDLSHDIRAVTFDTVLVACRLAKDPGTARLRVGQYATDVSFIQSQKYLPVTRC